MLKILKKMKYNTILLILLSVLLVVMALHVYVAGCSYSEPMSSKRKKKNKSKKNKRKRRRARKNDKKMKKVIKDLKAKLNTIEEDVKENEEILNIVKETSKFSPTSSMSPTRFVCKIKVSLGR